MKPLRLGTRGSRLALLQAQAVADALPAEVEIVTITTAGDVDRARGDKSRWIEVLEERLLGGEIDLAVHSVKDVPAELAAGTTLAAVPERAAPADALVGVRSLAELPAGATVGTSSLRRRSQLLAIRPDLRVVDHRGNVDTRLGRLDGGLADALVLAEAGLERLGVQRPRTVLVTDSFIPAAGQGALGVQTRSDGAAADAVRTLDERRVRVCVDAERAVVRALGAACDTPVGVYASADGEERMTVRAFVGLPDGSEWTLDSAPDADELVARLRAAGVEAVLERAHHAQSTHRD